MDRGEGKNASSPAIDGKVVAGVATSTDFPVLGHVVENGSVHVATADRVSNELRDLLKLVVDHDGVVLDGFGPLVGLFNLEEF